MISPTLPLPSYLIIFGPCGFAGEVLAYTRLPRLSGDELLPAVDVVGCTRKGSVGHDVYG